MDGREVWGLGVMGETYVNSFENKVKLLLNKVEAPDKTLDNAYELCVKADALRIQNYFEESVKQYLACLSFDQDNIDAYKGLGLSYRHIGNIKESIQAFEQAKKLAPFDKIIRTELGYSYSLDRNFPKAQKEIKCSIKLDPEYIDAQAQLAAVHELAGETEMAIKICKKIIDQRPSYIAAYNTLGNLYIKLGLLNKAIDTLKTLLKINPDFSRAYLGIAISYDKMGNSPEAIRFYKKYIQLKPSSSQVPYISERLEELKKDKKIEKNYSLKLIVSN